jgi:hypothetical protein
MNRTLEIAHDRLNDLIGQRDELDSAIDDLREQIKWGEKIVSSMNQARKAAE